MKTLYESILDDEDILVNKSKETVRNPFKILKIYYDETYSSSLTDSQWLSKWRIIVDEILRGVKLPRVTFDVFRDYIKFISKSGKSLFEIHFDEKTIQFFKKGSCCILVNGTTVNTKAFSNDEIKIVKDICKQYDFKPTNHNHGDYNMWWYLDK